MKQENTTLEPSSLEEKEITPLPPRKKGRKLKIVTAAAGVLIVLDAVWRGFNDTNLDSLVTVAIQSNLTLRVAEAHVREARAERDVAFGRLWPSVGSSASYSRNRFSQNSFPPLPQGTALDYNLYNAGFDAAWEPTFLAARGEL